MLIVPLPAVAVAVNVEDCPVMIDAQLAAALAVGAAVAVTVVLAVLVQPLASVTVTVYEEPVVGATAVAEAVVPLLIAPGPDHEYEVKPVVAFNVALLPAQTGPLLEAETVG